MLRGAESGGDPRLTIVGLAWGFASVAAIAFYGIGRPRVEADLTLVERTANKVVIQVGMSNVLGDRPIRPLVNVLFSIGTEVHKLDSKLGTVTNIHPGLKAPVHVRGEDVPCFYTSDWIDLTPGDATVMRCEIPLTDGDRVLVVVRLDSVEIEDGRCERGAFINGGASASLDVLEERTA
jgi:hypothetical protein